MLAGLAAAATAAAFYGVGELTDHTPAFGKPEHLANIAGHGAVGCLSAMASSGGRSCRVRRVRSRHR